MSEYLVQVTLPHVSGFAEDNVVNTFAIDAFPGWDPATELLDISSPITGFYNHVHASGQSVARFLGTGLSRAALACRIKYYDIAAYLDGSPHGSPVAEDGFTLANGLAASTLPEEVAVALTLRADTWQSQLVETADGSDEGIARDRPRQRHTGKVYVGPLVAEANQLTNNKSRVDSAFRTCLLDSIERVQDQLRVNGHNLCVWSRADEDLTTVTHAQVDDAFDTQRRRGGDSTSRTTRVLVP